MAQGYRWDIGVFVTGVNSVAPQFDWRQVIEHMDVPEFFVGD